MADILHDIEHAAIGPRKLTAETSQKFGYGVSTYKGNACQVAPYIDPKTRQTVAQKLRFADKTFTVVGDTKAINGMLFGAHLWPSGCSKKIVITEGEVDCLTVSQVQNHKFAVVSLPAGAGSAERAIKTNLEYLEGFEEVILMFDADEAGRAAVELAAPLLSPGKVKVADLPMKDASDLLKAGRASDIVNAIWNAKTYQPDGLFTLTAIRDEVLAPVEMGAPWFLESLTASTYGRRIGQVIYFGAGTGIGKTDFFTQQIEFDINTLGAKCGVIYLEQPPGETGKRIAGKAAGRAFHIPNAGWTQDELVEAFERLEKSGKLILGGHFAAADWEVIKARIRFMAVAHGCKHIYLDHLTALADTANERESLEQITKELALMAQELGIIIHVISHLATPDGTPHEEGGRVMLRHFKGSRAIGFWAHFAFGLERNPQHEDPAERCITTLRCLKDRYTGRANGFTLRLAFDINTTRLSEAPPPPDEDPFEDGDNEEVPF